MNNTPPPFTPREAAVQAASAPVENADAIPSSASEAVASEAPAAVETADAQPPAAEAPRDIVAGQPAVVAGLDAATAQRIADLLADAEARGYLRGRNEKIEATQHFTPAADAEANPERMPVYAHRSIWDSAG